MFRDDAPLLIKAAIGDSLNLKLVETLYAAGVEKVGIDRYLDRASKPGQKPASWSRASQEMVGTGVNGWAALARVGGGHEDPGNQW
ncbi:hypothetical protein KAJ02_08525 [Candidatus Bipolaricaulota bacterium]|nr:hypothetical protein [Candidatus Bipolaricaulota bacterium]